MKRSFTYHFWGINKSKMVEISAYTLTSADQQAAKIMDQLSERWGCSAHFYGPVDFMGQVP